MMKTEFPPHTPDTHPPSITSSSDTQGNTDTQGTENEERRITITITNRTRGGNLYTYPSRLEHYRQSDLNEDIMKNPSLYMGSADF